MKEWSSNSTPVKISSFTRIVVESGNWLSHSLKFLMFIFSVYLPREVDFSVEVPVF